jgi:hypothetical protein
MIDLFRPHGADYAGLVYDVAHTGKKVAQHLSGLAKALEFVSRPEANQLLTL